MKILYVIKIFIMEILESVLRNIAKLRVKSSQRQDFYEIGAEGFFVIENFLPERDCNKCKDIIDKFISEKGHLVWKDEVGSDTRIYFANKYISEVSEIFSNEFIRKSLTAYTGCLDPVGFAMASKLSHVDGNLGSGGGWHRDTLISHQFKAILYLDDVTPDNGPFQYIRSSNRKRFIFNSLFGGDPTFGKTRFTEENIKTLLDLNDGVEVVTFSGKKGTLLLVDTKGIHRGMPIKSGSRYAVTTYFWNKEIPKHIGNLEVN
jgi:hypothetical protein